jgi:Leucine-rich repeat (LRR) protein
MHFAGCAIHTLPGDISKFIYLVRLNLRQNRLVSCPKEIGGLKRLKSLNLRDNELTDNLYCGKSVCDCGSCRYAIPPEIGNCTKLSILLLRNNRLTRVPAELENLHGLERLDLQENSLHSIPCDLSNLRSLEELSAENQWEDQDNRVGRQTLEVHDEAMYDAYYERKGASMEVLRGVYIAWRYFGVYI